MMNMNLVMPRWLRRGLLASAVVAGAAALLPSDAFADIFVYTDDEGGMHFTNMRKPGSKLYVRARKGKKAAGNPTVKPKMPSDRSIKRFTRYDKPIREAATLYQIPEELIRAVIKVESNYDPSAVSSAGAQGLMQLMPATALRMQSRDSFDPTMAIFSGTRYLRILANTFNGDLELTVAGYNAGEGAVMRHGGIPPYEETQNYVLKVLHYYHLYRTIDDVTQASMGG